MSTKIIMDRISSSVLYVLLLLTCFRASSGCRRSSNPSSNAGFTGMFVFGNSLMDGGNNNFLISTFKANYPPYGIDFQPNQAPTGRFTNAKNQADKIGDLLMVPPLPAFLNPLTKGLNMSRGVNHASAGSGIIDATGATMGVVPLSQQIRNFLEVTLPNVEAQQGCQRDQLLGQYLFLFSTGSNDYLTNFFQGGSRFSTLEQFTSNMISSLASQITKLYAAGARKFAFLNIGPLGCTPNIRAATANKACNETLNYAAFLFNTQLVIMLDNIKPQMPGFQYVSINFFQMVLMFIRNPSFGGFTDVTNSCCQVSLLSMGALCTPLGSVCTNRSTHLFFDGLHPTEPLYAAVSERAYSSNDLSEVYPINIQKLAQL